MLTESVLLFAPGIICVSLYRQLEKKKWNVYTYIENYGLFSFLIYFLNWATIYLRGWKETSIRMFNLDARIKYEILSVIYAVGIAYGFHFGKKYFHKMRM